IRSGDYVSLFLTGLGNKAGNAVVKLEGDITLPPSYAGPAPQFPGLDQVNIQFPAGASGTIRIFVGKYGSNPVTLSQ
ncbi:MAG TPA: hypothetical protein VMZ52_00040, partial [Bryobacteraceae bacterium]|nr:hypothetical protein [Bryobacteraceae bacterium]